MRIQFKSLIVLHESESRFGDTTTTRTIYDMNSVRDHAIEISWSALLFHPQTLWRLAVFMCLPVFLMALWTQGHAGLMLIGLLPFLLLFWSVSYAVAKQIVLTDQARLDRGSAEDDKVAVVPCDRWTVFVSKLQKPSSLDTFQMRGVNYQALRAAAQHLEAMKRLRESR